MNISTARVFNGDKLMILRLARLIKKRGRGGKLFPNSTK